MRTVEETTPKTLELRCGCEMQAPTRTSGRRVSSRCEEAERLWSELLEARDEMRATQWSRIGKKQAIDAFAEARSEFHAHVSGDVS